MKRDEMEQQALAKAVSGQSLSNYPAIIAGFLEKGIPESEIKPRENVFTYNAWKALGRQVRRGEHGVRVGTYVPMERTQERPDGTSETVHFKRSRLTTVFHVSQTEPVQS